MQGFIRGHVRITVGGAGLSRFINLAARAGVEIEDIEKIAPHSMNMTVGVADFFRLRPCAKAARCSIHITHKSGLPFVRAFLRLRPFLLLGMLAAAALIIAASGRIWAISVEGCDADDAAQIRRVIEGYGIAVGRSNSRMDTEGAINDILQSMPGVSWAGINTTGVHVRVQIKEVEPPPIIIDRDEPCDIVADRNAVIEDIIVLDGTARVKPGDTVYKGQILIEGVAVRTGGLQRVHALGEVTGRTTVSAYYDTPVFTTARTPTGRAEIRRSIETPFGEFPYADEEPYDNCDSVITYRDVSRYFLPVRLKYVSYYEVTEALKPRDNLALKTESAHKSHALAEKLVEESASIVDKKLDFVHIDNVTLRAVCTLELLTPIGESKKAY